MKKQLLTISVIALCLLMICAACGENKQPSTDTPATPDSTAGNDGVQKTDEPTDNQADTQQPEDTLSANTEALKAYYAFLNDAKSAINIHVNIDNIHDEKKISQITQNEHITVDRFAFLDIGSDGVLEMVLEDYNFNHLLFYENNILFYKIMSNRSFINLRVNGFCEGSGGVDTLYYELERFAPEKSEYRIRLASVIDKTINQVNDPEYRLYYDYADGEYVQNNRLSTQKEVEAFIEPYLSVPLVKWYLFTKPFDFADLVIYAQNAGIGTDYLKPEGTQQPEDTQTADNLKDAESPCPDDTAWAANRDVLRLYYEFLTGSAEAYDVGQYVMTGIDGTVTMQGKNPVTEFAFVDFGSDGVLELVMADDRNLYHSVLFCENGRLYRDGITHRGTGGLNYNGLAFGSGGTAGRWNVITVSSDIGCREQHIAGYMLGDDVVDDMQKTIYHIMASYEDGVYVRTPLRQVSEGEYDAFVATVRLMPKAQWHRFTPEVLKEVFADVAAVTDKPVQPAGLYIPEADRAAFGAYYGFLTEGAAAFDVQNGKNVTLNELTQNGQTPVAWAKPVDFGSDGRREIVMFRSTDLPKTVLFYEEDKLYLGYMPEGGSSSMQYNGVYSSDTRRADGKYDIQKRIMTCTAEEGCKSQHVVSFVYRGEKREYYAYAVYENGEYVPCEEKQLTLSEYQGVLATLGYEEAIPSSFDPDEIDLRLFFLGQK